VTNAEIVKLLGYNYADYFVRDVVNVCNVLRSLGLTIETQERVDQLQESYERMLAKYYEADEALHNVKRAMQMVLTGHVVVDLEDDSAT